jgi:KTSC domain
MQLIKAKASASLLLITASLIVLSGCGSLPALNGVEDNTSTETVNQTVTSNTGGDLIYIESDNVMAAGYDANSMIMSVQFDNGALYEYYNVPYELWEAFVSAQPHPWSQVGYPRLVNGGYEYRRVN